MKKALILIITIGAVMIYSCDKEEKVNTNCANCTGSYLGKEYNIKYCNGDTIINIYEKNSGALIRSQKFNGTVDSFKKFTSKNYGLNCN
jgi:hypothetical protein